MTEKARMQRVREIPNKKRPATRLTGTDPCIGGRNKQKNVYLDTSFVPCFTERNEDLGKTVDVNLKSHDADKKVTR